MNQNRSLDSGAIERNQGHSPVNGTILSLPLEVDLVNWLFAKFPWCSKWKFGLWSRYASLYPILIHALRPPDKLRQYETLKSLKVQQETTNDSQVIDGDTKNDRGHKNNEDESHVRYRIRLSFLFFRSKQTSRTRVNEWITVTIDAMRMPPIMSETSIYMCSSKGSFGRVYLVLTQSSFRLSRTQSSLSFCLSISRTRAGLY